MTPEQQNKLQMYMRTLKVLEKNKKALWSQPEVAAKIEAELEKLRHIVEKIKDLEREESAGRYKEN